MICKSRKSKIRKNPVIKGKFKINKVKNNILKEIEYFKTDQHEYEIHEKFGFLGIYGFYKDLLDKLHKLESDEDLKIISNYLEDVKDHSVLILKDIHKK